MVLIDNWLDDGKYYMDCQFLMRRNAPTWFSNQVTVPSPPRAPSPQPVARLYLKRQLEPDVTTEMPPAYKYARCVVTNAGGGQGPDVEMDMGAEMVY